MSQTIVLKDERCINHETSPGHPESPARLEAIYEAAELTTLRATWLAGAAKPNNMESSVCKAHAGSAVREVTQAQFGSPSVFRLSDPEETDVALKLYGADALDPVLAARLDLAHGRERQGVLVVGHVGFFHPGMEQVMKIPSGVKHKLPLTLHQGICLLIDQEEGGKTPAPGF